jgi:hypothetical protein
MPRRKTPATAVLVPLSESRRLEQSVPNRPTHPTFIPDSVEDPRLTDILQAIMEGKRGFGKACVAHGLKPCTVRTWAIRDVPDGFRAAYKEARRVEQDAFAEDILEIAAGENREGRDTAGAVYRDQLDVKTRQWVMARRAPEDFGDRGPVDESGKPVARQVIVIGNQSITF